jgi:hypothetical protein
MLDHFLSQRVTDLMQTRNEIKRLKKLEDELREIVVTSGVLSWEGREHLLPTTTISIPDEFWETTKFESVEDFVDSRFPTWDLIDKHEDHGALSTILILRKKPEYMPFIYDDDDVKVNKVSVEPTPEIDQETLMAERPDLYRQLFKPVTVMELDEQALSDAIEQDQEIPAILMRHQFSSRAPQQRISASEVKSGS